MFHFLLLAVGIVIIMHTFASKKRQIKYAMILIVKWGMVEMLKSINFDELTISVPCLS
jgi:hypothetical protein